MTVTAAADIGALQRIAVKLFLTDDAVLEPRSVIPVFHRWIQTHAVDGLLIDVADYSHMATGPCVLLVAHEGHYALDRTDGRLGLQYTRTRPLEGPLADRLASITRTLLGAAQLLETESTLTGPVRFAGNEIECVANDRLLAPNDGATLAAIRPALDRVLTAWLHSTAWTLTRMPDPRAPFRVTARAEQATPLATIAARLVAT